VGHLYRESLAHESRRERLNPMNPPLTIGEFGDMIVGPNLSSQTTSESPLREIYVSTDIETDGPLAGKHSMLSIGSAAYLANKDLLLYFQSDLHLVDHWRINRRHYQKTAEAWLQKMDRHRALIFNLLADTYAEHL